MENIIKKFILWSVTILLFIWFVLGRIVRKKSFVIITNFLTRSALLFKEPFPPKSKIVKTGKKAVKVGRNYTLRPYSETEIYTYVDGKYLLVKK